MVMNNLSKKMRSKIIEIIKQLDENWDGDAVLFSEAYWKSLEIIRYTYGEDSIQYSNLMQVISKINDDNHDGHLNVYATCKGILSAVKFREEELEFA